jgi:hypothetical protein
MTLRMCDEPLIAVSSHQKLLQVETVELRLDTRAAPDVGSCDRVFPAIPN